MAETRHNLGFSSESLELLPILTEPEIQELYRDVAPETLLYRFVHRPHSTATERFEKAIAAAEKGPLHGRV